jgi:hypothetical protein
MSVNVDDNPRHAYSSVATCTKVHAVLAGALRGIQLNKTQSTAKRLDL